MNWGSGRCRLEGLAAVAAVRHRTVSRRSRRQRAIRSRRTDVRASAYSWSRPKKRRRPNRTAPRHSMLPNAGRLLLLPIGGRVDGLRPSLGLGLEVGVVVIGDVNPRMAHLVDGAIAPADPLIRIRV